MTETGRIRPICGKEYGISGIARVQLNPIML
jgi:hypothetical protein